jgi:subtilase family serine protease
MNGTIRLIVLAAALAAAACNAGGSSNLPTGSAAAPSQSRVIPQWEATGTAQRVCPDVPAGYARCDALISTNVKKIGPAVPGWTPANFQAVYNLPSSTKGSGQIVAIVDAYDNPNTATDLSTYRSEFGLGTAKFTKYNQDGQTSNYPEGDAHWGLEIDLDIEMVSATCPLCTIDLVEANSNATNDLEAAEAEAVKLGAHIISNSWGCTGSNSCVDDSYFDKTGVTYLASAGDGGYGTQAPAALSSVVAVGGTVMSESDSKYTETVWGDSGAGCATGVTKPSWQHDPKCSYRTMNDVAAVSWFASEYDSYSYGGWIVTDGTSVSSPLVAGIFGLAGNATKQNGGERLWKLKKKMRTKYLHDITTGSVNGCPASLKGTYMCSAGTDEFGQYSAPDGWGTPDGIKAL